jgi:SAM-dependent methyltransferase
MLLKRSRKKIVHNIKEIVFCIGGIQTMLDENEKMELEKSMGFQGQWEEHRRFQVQFLQQNGLLPHHNFLEIGCGPLTAGLPIIKYLDESNYTGIDIRASVLNMSWMQVGKAGLSEKNPCLLHTANFGDTVLGNKTFDFVHSFSVLFHLSDELLDACFKSVARRLKPNGVYYANINTESPSDRWLEFPFVRRTVADYDRKARLFGLKIVDLGSLADLGFQLPGEEKLNRMLRIELV